MTRNASIMVVFIAAILVLGYLTLKEPTSPMDTFDSSSIFGM